MATLNIPNTFTNGTPAIASEVNANFNAVKTFSEGLSDGTNIDSGSITNAKLADSAVTEGKIATNAVTQAKLADRSVGSAELDNLTLNAQTGTTYTLVITDAHKLVTLSNASAVTLTIPADASVNFDVGDQVNLLQLGAGQVTVVGASGVTLRAQGTRIKMNGQYSLATVVKIAANEWVLVGNTVA